MVQQQIQPALGQPVVVENRPGGGGTLGTAQALRAAPDGQTIVLTTDGVMTLNPFLYPNVGFDPATATPLTLSTETVVGVAVHNSVPAKNIPDLIAYAKANPGKVTFGTSGAPQQIIGEMLNRLGGVQMQHVPYKGVAPALTDLVGGHINVVLATITSILPHVGSGSIRVIGVSGKDRFKQLPEVQAIAETFPEIVVATWSGFFAPPGTPKPIAEKLSAELIKALNEPDIVEKLAKTAETVVATTPAEASARAKADTDRWANYLKQVKIKVE
jgi:tripartite-type tricarboxylate transporter receptor subunit TctC